MKAVMISIQPRWCDLIASGKKTLEIRKTQPKLKPPFKCYIYCTLAGSNELFHEVLEGDVAAWNRENWGNRKGNVIGEFVCDRIRAEQEIADQLVDVGLMLQSCLSSAELLKYANGKVLYSWHISNLVIYDKPKHLDEFKQCHKCEYYANCYEHEYSCDGAYNLTRPPQSWCYVEEA